MKVTVVHCGPPANESELKALEHLESRLKSSEGEDEWVLLANLAFSVTHQLQSEEIDIVAVGPPGAQVIEVKHWTAQWVGAHVDMVEEEAERVMRKARKIGTTLRRIVHDLPRVDGAFLLTQDPSKVKRISDKVVRGVAFHSLADWKGAIGFDCRPALSSDQVRRIAQALEPRSRAATDGSIRRLAGYVNLELQTPKDQRFHRIYKATHSTRQDRVVLHLYDLSAADDKNAETKAKREFEALQRLQLHRWAPRVLDSYQGVPGYPGELFFFSLSDPAAPPIEERAADDTWDADNRLAFAREAVRVLRELHSVEADGASLLHRNLTPRTILVMHDNSPILTGFERAKIPSDVSVASGCLPAGDYEYAVAPEIRRDGLGAADQRSDVYSLCASLGCLFDGRMDRETQRAAALLEKGATEDPVQRITLDELGQGFSELLGESPGWPAPPPARFWTEDQVVRFRDQAYRIVARLGSGGVGTTFKVVEISRSTGDELGTYVAKVVRDRETGKRVLAAYSLARSHLARHPGLSAIFEVAQEWRENSFVALLTWIESAPLRDFMGVFPLLAEEQHETSGESLARRWLHEMCETLDVLHRNGLVHGDVSPGNMIVSGSDLVLTDYDFVSKIGERSAAPGTVMYSAPVHEGERCATSADDFYALAASFFHVIFEKEPFLYGGERAKERGLSWEGVDRGEYPVVADFLDRATHPDAKRRFPMAAAALAALEGPPSEETRAQRGANVVTASQPAQASAAELPDEKVKLREERVEWLLSLLQSYPGSRWGNRETRGLDTEFAAQTYVETELEETLLRDVQDRRVRLVILCGNAGDGKTALLQHLASQLGLGAHPSSERILEGRMENGLLVRMNLDGSAAWRGRSADEILDEFLAPFQEGAPAEDIVHLLAINDGRLLEWIESVEDRHSGNPTALTAELYELLQQEAATQQSHIRFVNLNQRSLVGNILVSRGRIETGFLERLIDHLYGGEEACTIWAPCQSCSAKDRCDVFLAARIFGPDGVLGLAEYEVRKRARLRLFEALQTVHLRGETHITVRELRAALVYILFGIHFCSDYHDGADTPTLPYWDRAFLADSPGRQGGVLLELVRLDPALEAHPQIDRHLVKKQREGGSGGVRCCGKFKLDSARRWAFFELTEEEIEQIAGDAEALGLAQGCHLRLFRDFPLEESAQPREGLCQRLCAGISRLEDLPSQALERENVVPLRITPHTPTESAFWVEKPLDSFRLEADVPPETEGVGRLHRQALLIYRYRDGQEERLHLGADLFHLLLDLADGYQLGDVSTDDTFAQLSIFVQRLVREDERELLAWTPMLDDAIFKVSAAITTVQGGARQRLVLRQLGPGGGQ